MPIYEYQCQTCHRTLEKRQKFSDPELTVCPYCEGPLEKMISAPAIQFKGGGWYADGYGNKAPAKASGSSDSGASSGSTSESGANSDNKSTSSTPASSSSDSSSSSSSTPAASAPASAPAATPSK